MRAMWRASDSLARSESDTTRRLLSALAIRRAGAVASASRANLAAATRSADSTIAEVHTSSSSLTMGRIGSAPCAAAAAAAAADRRAASIL